MQVNPVLATWRYDDTTRRTITVLPDGCHDLVLRCRRAGEKVTFVHTELDDTPRTLGLPGQENLAGLRLRPGVRLRAEGLALLQQELSYQHTLEEAVTLSCAVLSIHAELNDDLIVAATSSSSVQQMARALGVSERTVHRRALARTGRPPSFWLDLARARRAAREMLTDLPLVEVALATGYSDQPHLTRAFRLRFGVTPAAFRRSPSLMRLAAQPGFSG